MQQGQPTCAHCGLVFRNGSQYVRVGPKRDVYHCRSTAPCENRRVARLAETGAAAANRVLAGLRAMRDELNQLPGVRAE